MRHYTSLYTQKQLNQPIHSIVTT